MAVDKLVDSTQLNSDLTSVANAIRTKGGTSADLAFPAGFVSAVQAIPTGTTPTGTKQISITQNGTTTEDVAAYANAEITVNVSGGGSRNALFTSGDIVVASNVGISANGTLFPGLQLPFVPDFLSIWIDKDSFAAIETPINNHFYHIQVEKYRSTFPLVRLSGDKSSESEGGWVDKGFAFLKGSSVNAFNSDGGISGYGLSQWVDVINTPNYPNWNLNSDGTLTMAKISSAAVTLYAGTYHYIAFKEASS